MQETVDAFTEAFETLGYERTQSRAFRFGYQKVAVYAKNDQTVTHMARQHFLGKGWLSKLGDWEDILHPSLDSIEGDPSPTSLEYGRVVQILERNWWIALRFGLFRCWAAAFRFWVYRIQNK
jgi:hypothetical protein